MKKILLMFMAVSLFGSCSDDKTDTDINAASITLSESVIEAGADGATVDVKVTSSGDWRVAGNCDWARPSVTSGANGESISFTVDANEVGELREATFKVFTGSAVAQVVITSSFGDFLNIISPEAVYLSKVGQVLSIEIKTNLTDFQFDFSDLGAEWITYKDRTDAFDKTMLRFDIVENSNLSDRSSTISINSNGIIGEMLLSQSQTNEILVDPISYDFDLADRKFSIDVDANVEYTVRCDAEWITEVPATRGLTTKNYQFHLDASSTTRVGTISMFGSGVVRQIFVIQKNVSDILVDVPDAVFRQWLNDNGWVVDLGGKCVITDRGVNATELNYPRGYSNSACKSVEGINALVNLTKIDLNGHLLRTFDISKLSKVTSVDIDRNSLEQIHLGANPIETLAVSQFFSEISWPSNYYSAQSTVVTGSMLKSLLIPRVDGSYYDPADALKTVDVSGCPALTTLNCMRDAGVLKTIYLKQGQVIPNFIYTNGAEVVYK